MKHFFSSLIGVSVMSTNGKKGIGLSSLAEAIISEVEKSLPAEDFVRLTYGSKVEDELYKIQDLLIRFRVSFYEVKARRISVKLFERATEIVKKIDSFEHRARILHQASKSRPNLNNIFGESSEIILGDAWYRFRAGAIKQAVQV